MFKPYFPTAGSVGKIHCQCQKHRLWPSVTNVYCVVRVQDVTIIKGIYKPKDMQEQLFLLYFFCSGGGLDWILLGIIVFYFSLAVTELCDCITHALPTTSKMQHRHRKVFSVQDLSSHCWDNRSYTCIFRIYLSQGHKLTALLSLLILICKKVLYRHVRRIFLTANPPQTVCWKK